MEGNHLWGKRGDMIVHQRSPFNAEPPRSALAGHQITDVALFYSRNHGTLPDLTAANWRLRVDGLVNEPLTLTVDELRTRFGTHAEVATLQCAGNRRAGFNEVRRIDGEDPWGPGATSTAEWRGARLADVLTAAGASRDEGLHVAFSAPDVSDLASPAQPYGASIPLQKALSGEVLLAWDMNGEPLPRIHGGPVRVLVPGYIGARSVKWVTRITVQPEPSDNYFQARAYRILPPDAEADTARPGYGIALSSVALNCDILTPDEDARVAAGPLRVAGYAFAGDDRGIARVDVSVDGGRTWRQADLGPEPSRWAWRLWAATIDVAPGTVTLTARAWDTIGATQPECAASLWNPKGYANNSWARLHVTVGS